MRTRGTKRLNNLANRKPVAKLEAEPRSSDPYAYALSSRKYSFLELMHLKTLSIHCTYNEIIGFVGGSSVILRGTGFDGISLVLFGSQPCPINTNTSNSVRIECEVPSRVRNSISYLLIWGRIHLQRGRRGSCAPFSRYMFHMGG